MSPVRFVIISFRSVVYEFTCPGCKSRYIGKTDRCFYTSVKEHARDSKSEIFEHCEHFQHIKSILELYPDDQTNLSQTCILPEFIFNNSHGGMHLEVQIVYSKCCYCVLSKLKIFLVSTSRRQFLGAVFRALSCFTTLHFIEYEGTQ